VLVQNTSRYKLGAHQHMQGACGAHVGLGEKTASRYWKRSALGLVRLEAL